MRTIYNYNNSKGDIYHYLFEEIGSDGYIKLIEESVKEINNILPGMLANINANQDECEALCQLKETYLKTLEGKQTEIPYSYEEGIEYIKNCKIIARCPVLVKTKEHKYRNEITKFKALWRTKLPIGKYVSSFKLDPLFYERVIDGMDPMIKWEYL